MKKKHLYILGSFLIVIALIIIVMVVFFIKSQSNLENLTSIGIQDIDLSKIEDGNYEGSYESFPVSVEVNVEVKNHEIIDIKILKHVNGQGGPAEKITEHIIEAQSLKVDAIAGATYSSMVIIKAVEDALK